MLIFFLAAVISNSVAFQLPTALVHRGYTHERAAEPDEFVRVVLGIKQDSELIRSLWNQVSDPTSEMFGQFLTAAELQSRIAPNSAQHVKQVEEWAKSHHATAQVTPTVNGEMVHVHMPVTAAESAFGVTLHHFSHARLQNGHTVVRTVDPVSVPAALASIVDLVGGLGEFSHRPVKQQGALDMPATPASGEKGGVLATDPIPAPFVLGAGHYDGFTEIWVVPYCGAEAAECEDGTQLFNTVASITLMFNSTHANGKYSFNRTFAVTPAANTTEPLRLGSTSDQIVCGVTVSYVFVGCGIVLTDIPHYIPYVVTAFTTNRDGNVSLTSASPAYAESSNPWILPDVMQTVYKTGDLDVPTNRVNASAAIVALLEQYFDQKDLSEYLAANDLPSGNATVIGVDDRNDPSAPGGETMLDVSMVTAAGLHADNLTVWYAGNNETEMVDWIAQVVNTTDDLLPKVFSLSYGAPENLTEVWGDNLPRMEDELAKLGIRGISVLVSSGDNGASEIGNFQEECGAFAPNYPTSSPYVLSVSGTRLGLKPGATPPPYTLSTRLPICTSAYQLSSSQADSLPLSFNMSCTTAAMDLENTVEIAASLHHGARWTTGGGFSVSLGQPRWQQAAVERYLNRSDAALPPSGMFNRTNRGFPDISALSDSIPIMMNGRVSSTGGTSASTPMLAGMFAQINQMRLANNRPLLGPIAPLLYHIAETHPEVFNDVTIGSNFCGQDECCPNGFTCVEGWDPVTGLGTPNMELLAKHLVDLPAPQTGGNNKTWASRNPGAVVGIVIGCLAAVAVVVGVGRMKFGSDRRQKVKSGAYTQAADARL